MIPQLHNSRARKRITLSGNERILKIAVYLPNIHKMIAQDKRKETWIRRCGLVCHQSHGLGNRSQEFLVPEGTYLCGLTQTKPISIGVTQAHPPRLLRASAGCTCPAGTVTLK